MEALRRRFLQPDREFSLVPFWFLNGKLTREEISRQLLDFKDHGIYGVVLHPRMGLDESITYLSEAYFDLIAHAVKVARELGMFVFLYDEGMYPSGSACGQVVRENPRYAARGLYLEIGEARPSQGRVVAHVAAHMIGETSCDYDSLRLLKDDERLKPGEGSLWLMEDFSRGTIRGLHAGEDDGQPDAPLAADILNPEAVRCFIRLTHERYYARMPEEFGTTIRAFFTDEPNPLGRNARKDMLAWTAGLEDEWLAGGLRPVDLVALFLDIGPQTGAIRELYERMINERLGRVYYRQIRTWCDAHGIALTGHPARADAFKLESEFSIPGQDLVWRFVAPGESSLTGPESTQAQCAADCARRNGNRRNLNESFGCCGPEKSQWGMTVADMKWMLDYLFVRGTNLIVPHAFFYATDTPLRLDRPPDVGPNNYWWPYYKQVATYIARMCAMNTDGVSRAKVAVLTDGHHLPWQAPAALLKRQIPFHYVLDADAREECVCGGMLHVGAQRYSTVVLERNRRISSKMSAALAALSASGGHVVYTDGENETQIKALEDEELRCVILEPEDAQIRASYQIHDDIHLVMLTNEGNKPYRGKVRLPVSGRCERWDAWTGEIDAVMMHDRWIGLDLNVRQSILFAVQGGNAGLEQMERAYREERIDLSSAFVLHALGQDIPMRTLCDWQRLEGLKRYNGVLDYEGVVELPHLPERAVLSLGDVREMAEVFVNDCDAVPLLLPPFEVDVTSQLKEGENRIRVRVTSCRATEMDGVSWECGLLGPVGLTLKSDKVQIE